MRVALNLTACAALIVGLQGNAQSISSGGLAPQETQPQSSGREPSPMQKVMGVLNRSQRQLRKQIKDPTVNQEALLKTLADMELAAHSAIVLVPKGAKGIAKDERSAWMIAYKRKMTGLLDSTLVMQDAALRADKEDLQEAYQEILETKKSGHKAFRDL